MSSRRWLVLGVVVLLVAAAGLRLALPELIRLAVAARVHAITGRTASLDAVDVALLRGRLSLRGFRLADQASEHAPFAEFTRLDLDLRLPALLRGHLWLREAILTEPTVRVIRYSGGEFNLSDLVRQSGQASRLFEITVDRFVVVNGTTALEDRALPEPRTWRSEGMAIEAHNLSSRPQYGTAVATSVTGGAPVSVRLDRLRLYPIDLEGTVSIDGVDLTMGSVYLPPTTPVLLERGRGSTSLRLTLDASRGLRVDGTARVEGVELARRGGGALARVPALTVALDGLRFASAGIALGQLALHASAAVLDPTAGSAARFASATFHARVIDLTWPVDRPAGLDLAARVQNRGSLTVVGTLHPPTAPSELRLRLDDFDLAPWAGFAPVAARLTGIAEADLRIAEPLRAGVPARVRGTIAVRSAGLWDGSTRLLGAQRIEASALELDWPDRLRIGQLAIREPRAVVERGRTGELAMARLFGAPPEADSSGAPPPEGAVSTTRRAVFAVGIGRVLVQDGTLEWRDQAVTPAVRAAFSDLTGTVTGAAWPIAGPLELRLAGRSGGSGQLQLAGRVGLTPLAADMRVTARAVDLVPYEPYLALPARLRAWTDLDLAVLMASPEAALTVRGRAALTQVDVRDGERTVFRAERVEATGLAVEWPGQVAVAHLALEGPWLLVERDEQGAMAMRAMLPSGGNGATSSGRPDTAGTGARRAPAVSVALLTADEGGARVVDRSVTPPFALDLRHLHLRAEGVSTPPGPRAQLDVKAQAGAGTALALRGTLAPVGGPLAFDLSGEIRGFEAARVNPYLGRFLAWQAAEGLLAARLEGRVQDDALNARVDVQLSRLQVVRAGPGEGSSAGAGLPLSLVVALIRDPRGDIRVSVPVGGRLSDPRFDFRETIRTAVRTVAINAITAPVSWIGRLHASPDSGIERVDVDPIRFEPASAVLTAEGRAQASRVAAFLGQFGEVRMGVAPVVSQRDLAVLRRQAAEAAIERLAVSTRIAADAAAAQLFRERLPDRPVPADPEATLAALADTEASGVQASTLAARRLETLQAVFKEAGIARARLVDAPVIERPDSTAGAIELSLLEPDPPRRSRFLQFLRELGGTDG